MNITESLDNSARLIAVEALNRFDKAQKRHNCSAQTRAPYASVILRNLLDKTNQKQRATDLVMGTIKYRSSIDLVLSAIADTPAKRIAPELINYIHVGLYELIYCPQTPEYSIINDAAENTKTIGGEKQVGFVNALLRKSAKRIISRTAQITQENIRFVLPRNNSNGCLFDRSFLADPKTQPENYLSCACSVPRFLIVAWLSEFGFEKTKSICIAGNRRPGIYIHPNSLKSSVYQLAELLTGDDVSFDITGDEKMIKLNSPGEITSIPGFRDGLFVVQDPTAAKPVIALLPKPGSRILDLCAAPGTKTVQLAELTNDKAEIIATDIDPDRLKKLDDNITRLGLSSIRTLPYEQITENAEKDGLFDDVLLDMPCSNTGVLAKRPEVRLRIKPKAIKKLTVIQDKLLAKAAKLTRPSGRICYSTCSIMKDENQNRIEKFLKEHPDFSLILEQLTLPADDEFDHDGGYFAIISRK